jgi:hypothetical protein
VSKLFRRSSRDHLAKRRIHRDRASRNRDRSTAEDVERSAFSWASADVCVCVCVVFATKPTRILVHQKRKSTTRSARLRDPLQAFEISPVRKSLEGFQIWPPRHSGLSGSSCGLLPQSFPSHARLSPGLSSLRNPVIRSGILRSVSASNFLETGKQTDIPNHPSFTPTN